ncbi:MAG: hypothetical protein KJO06_09870 [Gemmatimonadetes bacterium]|nr:hypothetical protein [Gemmatimonadota bacterium]
MTRIARVGVAVDPPLLADLLVSLLSGPYRRLGRTWKRGQNRCDLAIVSPAHTGAVSAPRVICLPDDYGDAGVGRVTTVAGSFPIAIRDIGAIERLLESYLPA